MANTYTQLHLQFVFAVSGRQNLVPKKHREHLHKYITGIVRERDHKMLAIFCMPDHAHVFVGMQPNMSVSDLVGQIKSVSSRFINEQRWLDSKFKCQEGYGGFSYSHSHIDRVCKYILNQEEHHRKRTFRQEYLSFLKRFEIEYRPEFLFDWIE